jgi:hypothetical protein
LLQIQAFVFGALKGKHWEQLISASQESIWCSFTWPRLYFFQEVLIKGFDNKLAKVIIPVIDALFSIIR